MSVGKEERKLQKLMIHVVKHKAQAWLSSTPLAFPRGLEGDLIIQQDCLVRVRSCCRKEGSA